MNTMSKLLFLSLALVSIAQTDDNQKTDRKLKDHIKAHNEKRKTYNNNCTRTITEQKALEIEIKKEVNQILESLIQEYCKLQNEIKNNSHSGIIDILQCKQNFKKNNENANNRFALLSKLARQCHEKNDCDEFHKLEAECLNTGAGKELKNTYNNYTYTYFKAMILEKTIDNAFAINDFEKIEETLAEAINHIANPQIINNPDYFNYVSIGQCTAPAFNQVKKEMMNFVNKTCYEENSQ